MSIVHGGLFADGQTLVAGFIAGILKHELVDSQDSRQDEASENVELSGVEIPAEEQVDKHGQLQADQNEDTFEMVEKAVEEQQEQHAEFTFRGSESPKKDNFIVDKQVGLSQATGGAENVPKRRTSSIDLPATPKLYQPPSLDELMEQLSAADPPPQHEAPFPTTEIEHDHAAEAEDPRLLNAVIGEPGIPNDDVDPIANLILATDLGEVDTGDISFEASEAQDLSTFDKEAVLDENIRLNSTYIVGGVLADGYPLIAGLTFGPSNLQGGHAEGTAVSDVDEQQNHVIPENSEGNVEVKDKITEISLEQSGFEQPVAEESAEAPVEAIESAEKPSEGLEASEKPSEDVEALLAAYDYKPAAPLAPDHSPDFPNEIPLESGGHEAEFSTKVHDEGYPKALEAIKLVDEQEKELSSEPRDPEEDDELVAVGEEAPHVHRLVVDPVGDALSEFGSNTSLKSFDPNEPGAGTPPELIAAAGIAEGIKFHATSKLNEYVVVGGLQSDGLPLIQGIQKAPIAPGEIKETNQTNPQKIEEKTEEKQEEQQGNNEENNDETTVTETTEEFHTARESLKDTLEEEEGFVKLISIKSECRDGQQGQVQLEHEKTPVNAEDIQIRVEEYDTKLESKVESNVIHDSPVHKSRSIPIIVEERVERNQQIPQGVGRPENNIQSEEDLREIEIRRENAPYGEKARQEPRVVIEPLERWASEEDLRAVGTDQSGQVPEKDPIQFEETAAAQRIDAENVAVLNGQQPTPTLPSGQNHSERVIPIRIQSEGTVKPAQNRTVREETVRTVQPEFTTEKFFETEGRLGDSGVHKSPTEPTDQSERVISTTVTQNTQIGPEEGNRGTVQNFDNRTVQNEGERNVPIRIVPAVNGSTLVVDLPSPSQESGFHSTNEVSPVPGTEPSSIISSILRNLRELKMSDKPKYDNIVERLRQLEEEMRLQHTGVPPDAQLTELVGKILQSEYPHSDLQIVVSASRKSTSHTQFYETETPGMVGLAPDQLRELQTKLMDKISGRNDYGKNVDAKDQPDDLKRRDANEEGWTNEDGTESVHKRTVRQITTTESSVKGIGDHPQPNEDTESVSSDSVKDRIARFESLKETAKFPIHRTVESELVEEETREHSGQTKEQEHLAQRPTELSIQRTAEGKETEAERLNETPVESPSTPQVVTEQREKIGRALTVESPPKSDTQDLAEPAATTPEEPQVSVHKLVQKFSHPSEGTADTASAAQFPEHHVVSGDAVARVDSREQIIVREEVDVKPSSSTIPATEQQKDREDIAQHVHKISVEQQKSVQVQPGFGDDIVNVSVQEKIRRLESSTSLESEHGETGFEQQLPEHQVEIGDHDEGLGKAEVQEGVQVRTKPPNDEEFAKINQARQEASEESTEIAGERKTLAIHRAVDEEVQDAETGDLGQKETLESHLEAVQTPELSTSMSSSVQQLGAGKSETFEVRPEGIAEQKRIQISRTAEQGVVEEDEGGRLGKSVEESHIKPEEEEQSYGKAAAAVALAAAGGFAAAVASSLHDDREYETRSPTEYTAPSDAPSESDKSPITPGGAEVAVDQSGRTGDLCEEDLLTQTPSESSEEHFTAEGPRSTRSIPIHHSAQGEVVEGQISETHGFRGAELPSHDEEYDTETSHKAESEAVVQRKAHEAAEVVTPSDSSRIQEPSPIDIPTPESAQEEVLESEPLSPRGASPRQAEEELEKEIVKREIEPVGDLEKELRTTESVEPVGTEKEISPDESTRQFLDQPTELEAEQVREATRHEQEVQQQREQTPEESDEAKKMGLGTMIAGAAILGGKALYDKLKGDKDQGEGYDGHDSNDDHKPEGGAGKIISETYESSKPQAEGRYLVEKQSEALGNPLEIFPSAASSSEEGPTSPPATPTKVVHVHEHYHEQITDKDGNLVDDVTFESNYDTREPSESSQRQSPLPDERKVSLAAVEHDVKAEPVSHFEEQAIHIDPSILPPSGTQTFHEERVETTEDLRRKSIKEDLDIHVVPKDDQHYQMHIHEERVEQEDNEPEKVVIERDYDIEAPSGTEITLPEADQPVENIREEVKQGFVSGQPESDVTESHYKVHEERHEQVLDADGRVIKDTTVVKDYDDEHPEPIEERTVHEADKEFVSELERRLSAASSAKGDSRPAEQQRETVEIAVTPVSEKEFTAEGPRSARDIDVYSAESTGLASPEAQKTSELQQKSDAGSTAASVQDQEEARDRKFLEELEQEQKEHEQHLKEVAEEKKEAVKSEIEPVGDLEKELRTTESVEPVGTNKESSPDESTRQFLDQPTELEVEQVRETIRREQEVQQQREQTPEESDEAKKMGFGTMIAGDAILGGKALYDKLKGDKDQGEGYDGHESDDDHKPEGGAGKIVLESYEYSYTDDGSGKPKEELEHRTVAEDDQGRLVEEVEHELPEVEYRSVGDSAKESPASVRKQFVETPESQGEISEAEPARKFSEDLHFEATQQKETPDFEVAQVAEPTTTSETIVESQGNYNIAGGALESSQAPAEPSKLSPAEDISAESAAHGTPETPEHHVEQHREDAVKRPERFSPIEDDIRVSPSQETPQEHHHVVTKDTYEYSYISDGEHQPHTEVTHTTSTQKDDGPVVEHEEHYDIPGEAVKSPGEPVVLERKYSVEHFDEPSSHSSDEHDVAGSPDKTSSPFEIIEQPSPVSDQIHPEPHHTVTTDSYEYAYTSDGVHEPHVEVTHKTVTKEDDGPVVEHEEHYDLSGKESIGSPNKPLESPAVQEIPQSARSEDLSRKSDTYSIQTGEAEPESEYQVEEIPEDQSMKSDLSPESLQKQESPQVEHDKVVGHHFGSTGELVQTVDELERRERHPSPLPEESEVPDRPEVSTEASVEVIGTPAEEQDFTAEGPRSRRDIDVYGAQSTGLESAEAQKTFALQRTEGEERHRGYEPIAQDEESEEGEDQGDKAKKMGLGTMIAGAAYLGGKAIYDKLTGDKQGYQQVPAEDFEQMEGDTVESYRHVGDSAKASPELTRKEYRTVHEFDDDFERPAVDEHELREKLENEADEQQRQGIQEVPGTQGDQEFVEGSPAPSGEPKDTVYIHEERHETVVGADGHVLKDITETRDYDTAHTEVYETRRTSIGEEERRTSYGDISREIEISPEDLPTTEEPKEVHVHEQHTEWSQDEFGHPREVEIVEDFDITEKTSDDHEAVQGEHDIHVHEKRVEHVVGFGGEDKEITTTREYDLHVPEGAEEVHLPDASEPIDQVTSSGDEPVHYHVHEERDEKVLDKEGHVLSDVKYVKDFDDEHPEDNVYELKSAEFKGEPSLPGDEHPVQKGQEGQLGDVQETSEELENISNASVKDLDIGDEHQYEEAKTTDIIEQQPIEGLTITERVPINRSPASDIVESEAMSTEHLDISQQPIRENIDAQEVEESRKIGPATMLAGAAAYGAMKLAEKLRGTGHEQVEEGGYPEGYRRRSETSPVGDIEKETAPSEDPSHQAEPVGSYDESSPCQSTTDYVTRDLEDYELASLQSQEKASPVDEQHEQHVSEPSEGQKLRDIEEKEESAQKSVDEIDNEPVELLDDQPYHSSTEEIRPRPHDLGIDAQENLDLQSPVSIATVRREDTDENLDIMQESIYIPADTPQSETKTPKTEYSYDIEQTPEFASEKYEGGDEEKDPMQQSIYIHHDEEGDQQQAYEEDEESGRNIMEQSVHELYDQREPLPGQPSELVESEPIEHEEEYYPDEQHHQLEDIHSETTPVGDLDRETHISGDIQLETEPVGNVEQQTTPSAPSWKEAEPVGNVEKEVATSIDVSEEAEPVVSHQEIEGDLEDVVDRESIERVDEKREKVSEKEEQKDKGDDHDVVESESVDEEKAQKIGLGTMLAGAAYLGGKALFDKLKGDKEEGEETVDSCDIVEYPEDLQNLQSPLRKDSKDEFERKSEISRESSQVLSSDSQITAIHVSERDGLVESESLDVETPEEMGSLSPKRRSFEEDSEPLVRSETVEHEASDLPQTPTPAKREVEWPKRTAEEERREIPSAPTETPSEAERELVESESVDRQSPGGLESPKRSKFEDSDGLVRSETIDESTVLQDTPSSPIHKEPISAEKVGEAFGVHELKEEEGHFEPDVHSPELVESEEIQRHLQEHHNLPKVLDYTVPRDQEGRPEETGGEVRIHEPAPSHKEPISPGKVGKAFGVHELKEEEERYEPNVYSPELVESEEIQHHLQEHHDLSKVTDFTVPRDREGHPQDFGGEADTHQFDRQALVESESIDIGSEESPASPKLSPQRTPVDIISPDDELSVEEKIRHFREDEEPVTTTGITEYQDKFKRIDEEHLVESEDIEQTEGEPGQIASEKEYLAQKRDSEEDLESPEAYERPMVSADDQEHHGLVESESIEHPEEPSSIMSESVYQKESPTRQSPVKEEVVDSEKASRSFDETPTTPVRKQSDLILSLDTLQQDIQRQFSQESAGGHELVQSQSIPEHDEGPKIESTKGKTDEFGLTEEEQVEMSALAKAIITSDVPDDIKVKEEPKREEKVEYESEDVVESAHIHTLPDEHHFEPSGDIHFIHREEHGEVLEGHEPLAESQDSKDELSKSVASEDRKESPQAAEESYDFDDVEIVESTDLDFEKLDESARQPAVEVHHEEEEEEHHETESPQRQEEDDFDIIQHDDIIDIQMTEEEIAKSEAVRAKDKKAHAFSPRLRGAESPTSTPLQDSELGLGVEESELTHKLEDLERPDLRKVRDTELERTDSAGSILRDRELTNEDFGGHMPDLSKDSESDDEKPTVERFDQGVEIRIQSELDEKHVDFDLVEKEGPLAPAEPIGRPHSPIPPRTQSVEQPETSPAGTSKTPESTRGIESVAEEEVGHDGQLEADQNEEAYDVAAKKMEADAKEEISPSNDSGSSNASSTVFVRKEINADIKMKDSDDGSQSSLLEFERLEQEVAGKQSSPGHSDNEQMVASATGSVNSLLEFENIEREVLEDQINQETIGQAVGPEVMILSDIREESEVEEMSIKGDDEDSLNEAQIIAEAMITSADSLEPSGGMSVLNRMETSIDSLEPQFSGSRQHHDDSLLDEGTSGGAQSQDTQAGMSADTAGTFQEYHDDDRDSLDGALDDYETITTFQTTQERPDGTTETIIRKVRTRTNDPVHSHVRFTGTESEDRLRNIEPEQEIESVDEEGNITKTIRRTLH